MTADHLARAKEYIAIAEATDSKREAYIKAAEEIAAHKAETGDQPTAIARKLQLPGRTLDAQRKHVEMLLKWRRSGFEAPTPFLMDQRATERAADSHARKVLRERPEVIAEALREAPASVVEQIAQQATEVAVERARAARAEHQTEPTVGELMGERFDPSESWADTLIIRANRNIRELTKHVERWGLVFGSMTEDEAYDYAQETERLAAEFRAAVQERVRDTAEVGR